MLAGGVQSEARAFIIARARALSMAPQNKRESADVMSNCKSVEKEEHAMCSEKEEEDALFMSLSVQCLRHTPN